MQDATIHKGCDMQVTNMSDGRQWQHCLVQRENCHAKEAFERRKAYSSRLHRNHHHLRRSHHRQTRHHRLQAAGLALGHQRLLQADLDRVAAASAFVFWLQMLHRDWPRVDIVQLQADSARWEFAGRLSLVPASRRKGCC